MSALSGPVQIQANDIDELLVKTLVVTQLNIATRWGMSPRRPSPLHRSGGRAVRLGHQPITPMSLLRRLCNVARPVASTFAGAIDGGATPPLPAHRRSLQSFLRNRSGGDRRRPDPNLLKNPGVREPVSSHQQRAGPLNISIGRGSASVALLQ